MPDGTNSKWIFVAGLSLLVVLLLFYLALTYTGAPGDAKASVLTAALGIIAVMVGFLAKALHE